MDGSEGVDTWDDGGQTADRTGMHTKTLIPTDLSEIARAQHWVVSRPQVLAAGCSQTMLSRLLRNGDWTRLGQGVYATRPPAVQAVCWGGILLADGPAAIGGLAAAHLRGVGEEPTRILVWGAVEIAHGFGVSDLIIGLTIVAVGTSLPELASSIIAARKGEHDIALGNILGSNLFNTLAVVGIAGTIHPLAVGPEVFNRDMLVMAALTLSLFVIGYGFRGPGRINRIEGAVLLVCYVGYTAYLISTVFGGQA